jgi:pimeloyl-ACP methyl ester carboxylesterase
MSFAIRIDGQRRPPDLAWSDEGSGTPVIFIHGWALDREMWEPQAQGLRNRFRILRMDRHGFGASHSAASLSHDVASIRAHVEQLDLGGIALVGMSQGARVALGLAEAIPERLACLVLDGAPWERVAQSEMAPEVPLERYRQILSVRGLEALRAELRRHPFVQLRNPQPESLALLERMISRYAALDLQSPAAPLVHRVSAINTPALLMNGDLDSLARRAMGDALAATLAHAERAVVRSAGHLANLDNPAEYNQILEQFIARHTRA